MGEGTVNIRIAKVLDFSCQAAVLKLVIVFITAAIKETLKFP